MVMLKEEKVAVENGGKESAYCFHGNCRMEKRPSQLMHNGKLPFSVTAWKLGVQALDCVIIGKSLSGSRSRRAEEAMAWSCQTVHCLVHSAPLGYLFLVIGPCRRCHFERPTRSWLSCLLSCEVGSFHCCCEVKSMGCPEKTEKRCFWERHSWTECWRQTRPW